MMTVFKALFLSVLSTLSSPLAHADVNMKDASYFQTWVDLEVPQGPRVFQLRRTYRSRSLHQGLWGFGWCSDFEKKLELRRRDQITLKDCRRETATLFKKKTPTLYESSDHEKIELANETYLLTTRNKTQQLYNKLGHLISLRVPNQDRLDLFYDPGGFLQKITINQSSVLHVKPDPLRRHIQSIKSPTALLTYRYESNNLVSAKNAWGHKIDYTYDDFHNLVRTRYPDRSQEILTYDREKDWILSIRKRDRCFENFKYTESPQSYIATAEKRCAGKTVNQTTYEFRHKVRADGTKYLDEVKVTQGSKVQRVSYQTGPLNEIP